MGTCTATLQEMPPPQLPPRAGAEQLFGMGGETCKGQAQGAKAASTFAT
jgi:hypothetical protein